MTHEKRETAIKWLQNEIRSLRLAPTINGCGPENWADLLEIMETCLEAVRGYFVVVNKTSPLKLDQLREMLENDGEIIGAAVIVSEDGVLSHAVLDSRVEDGICASTGASGEWLKEKDYGKTWLAYAYQTAHIDREAWTAEWRELHGDKMVGLDDCGDDVYRHYHYSVCTSCGKGSAVKPNFCPVCGKAMTPEAWAMLEKRLRG